MGPLAVLAMAGNATPPDSTIAQRPMHPFFSQCRPTVPSADSSAAHDLRVSTDTSVPSRDPTASDKSEDEVAKPASKRGKRRKTDQSLNGESPKRARPRKRPKAVESGGIADHFMRLGTGSVNAESKQEDARDPGADLSAQTGTGLSNAVQEAQHRDHDVPTDNSEAQPGASNQSRTGSNGDVPEPTGARPATPCSTKPRKLLQLNPKTGTIGSPPKPKGTKAVTIAEGPHSEKRPPARPGRKPGSKIVCISYGSDPSTRVKLGKLIDSILAGLIRHPAPSKQSAASANKEPLPTAPSTLPSKSSKATHPFFLGQTRKPGSPPEDSKVVKPASPPVSGRTKQYSSTPCSPRKPRTGLAAKVPMPQFGIKNLGLKFPGARLPAWPWKDMVHVRGNGCDALDITNGSLPLPLRKSKGNAVEVSPSESVVNLALQSLEVPAVAEAVRNINTDEVTPVPPELRLPQKHFESGTKLQARILPQLKTVKKRPDSHRVSVVDSKDRVRAPPHLARLYASIASSLSAFDMFQCETTNWAQKYAPVSAAEVLQPGREAFLLKDWLQALMVQSVDTGPAESDKPKTGSKSKASGSGKKKRRKKLDGFIVSSDDEDDALCELSDEEDDWAPSGSRGITRKTVVRSGSLRRGKDDDRAANALVISGPHGCGKTAAVYAVAKELDFEVFEINPGGRRSGKDVLEKIGDMTRNHHVQSHQPASSPDGQGATADDDTVKDIKSGKQATMNAFFRPSSARDKPKMPAKAAANSLQAKAKKDSPITQRQSLILLEEVDILYEEDKQFWATVVGLIAQSKRPFIMTCNDETLVPLHTLKLHGIFRLSPPPRDLAVDRLILIAANEGHALTRQSVEQVFDSRKSDLRAATMDLQYWCQMGIGDRKGGLDWYYPRWPKGVDLDENNEVIRVVSQDTYRLGMNLLGRDSITDPKLSPRLIEEEILRQAWDSWALDLGHWQDTIGLGDWAQSVEQNTGHGSKLGSLRAYEDAADAMSAADLCSSKAFAAFTEEAVDPTQPEIPATIRDDFVLGQTYIDTTPIEHFDSLTTSISLTIKSLARSSLQLYAEGQQETSLPLLPPLDETTAINLLQTSFKSTPPGTPVISRIDFAFAFDPIAAAPGASLQPASYLEPSVFDRTLKLIALDVAPFVRGIVSYEAQLQKQRLKLSNLVSEGGGRAAGSKRMRTTRAALSALEGGSRSTTRGERWFKADINPYLVAKTAGEGWNGVVSEELRTPEKSIGSSSKSSPRTPQTSPDTTPTKTPRKAVSKGGKRRKVLVDDDEVDELGC